MANSDKLWRRLCRRYEWCGDDDISNGNAKNFSTENEYSSLVNSLPYEFYSADLSNSSNKNISNIEEKIYDNTVKNEFSKKSHDENGNESQSDKTTIEDLHIDDVHNNIVSRTETAIKNNECRESWTCPRNHVSMEKYQNNKVNESKHSNFDKLIFHSALKI